MARAWKARWAQALESSNLSPSAKITAPIRGSRYFSLSATLSGMGPILEIGTLVVGLTIGAAVISYLIRDSRNTIGFVGMPRVTIDYVIACLDLKASSVLVDLGAGDGRVLCAARRFMPGIKLIGYENNRLIRHPNFEWHVGDLFEADIREVTHVVVYLHPDLNLRLADKLARELQPGARVVSVQYELPGMMLADEVQIEDAPAHATRLFVYDV